ncbi:hypothetical protein J6590_056313 [Homalodisca vitripennis]|nr:hypothetical protein J6590_056313 [Homalodisca vitripennis]
MDQKPRMVLVQAFYIPELDIRGKFSLQEGISSYSAELIAILQATFTLATIRQKDIIIFSDSQAAITALSNVYNYSKGEGIPVSIIHNVIDSGKNVTFHWVPAHVVVPSLNENPLTTLFYDAQPTSLRETCALRY